MESKIASESYTVIDGVLTLCTIKMKNGFYVTGESAPASPENFNADLGKKFVLALKSDNTLEYRPVTLGASVDGLRVVTSGLAASDVIVINGLQHVKPGIAVTPQKVAMDADRKGLAQVEGMDAEPRAVVASGIAPGARSQR